jgi:hypothetical protein
MPATVTTVEKFPLTTPQSDVEAERDLRIKAGAIRSTITKDAQNWILTTEWNVIGENDP